MSPEQSSRVGLITSGAQEGTLSMQLCVISIYVAQYTTGELRPHIPAEHSKPVPALPPEGAMATVDRPTVTPRQINAEYEINNILVSYCSCYLLYFSFFLDSGKYAISLRNINF